MKKRIAILGSTGSIGKQTIEVISKNADLFEVEVLTANNNESLLIEQAKITKPNAVVIANENLYQTVCDALLDDDIKVYAGEKAIEEIVEMESIDTVVTAMVGFSGLAATINAIRKGKRIALANKETLVVAGNIITKLAIENNAEIIPVDSEHSAIFQCLTGENNNPIEKIMLTASGGPFRTISKEQLKTVTVKEALNHPNWSMGNKITIDSASMMNKGLEVIEAKWLFGLTPDQIEVVIHPQSIVHSLVQFTDGSIKAQLGLPDMRLPIQYALGFPKRLNTNFPRFSFSDFSKLTFEQPNTDKFKCLALAYNAMNKGGNVPCIMNAANEVAVELFLNGQIQFPQIAEIIEMTMESIEFIKEPKLEDYFSTNLATRNFLNERLNKNK
ncbi:MAG: 1-deoxy-D-xylulose-5-phosphate reductoisomerase [Marinilabiliales bacterium]|nr:MAG: 1-deoxy-D-xylulose-5-phosphate reductoisomerase [Marinilabiliales bacterium]